MDIKRSIIENVYEDNGKLFFKKGTVVKVITCELEDTYISGVKVTVKTKRGTIKYLDASLLTNEF